MPSTKMLAALVAGRGNNLNVIRLLLSVMVIFSHSYPLTMGDKPDPLSVFCHGKASFGSMAVDLFFFISGILITSSWLNSRSMNDYLRRRILRIYPGYFCGLAFGFLAALFFADHPFVGILPKLGKFSDAIFLGHDGVSGDWIFLKNPFPCYANGSLWTIQWEFICYLLVAVIGLWGWFKHRRWLLVFLLGGITCYVLWHLEDGDFHWRFTIFFLAGVCVWLWRDKIPIRRDFALAALAFFVAMACWPRYGVLPMELAACYLVLWGGYAIKIPLMAWTQKVDLSYGVYLYAFPVQQIVAAAGVRTPWVMFVTATPLVMLLALASWFVVEKPCLSRKSCHFPDWDPGAAVITDSDHSVISTTKVG